MRVVPETRILIQPTVQLKWIEQHRSIEFQLNAQQQNDFKKIWLMYEQSGQRSVAQFLNSSVGFSQALFEEDLNFSLLIGADHIHQRYETFQMRFHQPELIWSI